MFYVTIYFTPFLPQNKQKTYQRKQKILPKKKTISINISTETDGESRETR